MPVAAIALSVTRKINKGNAIAFVYWIHLPEHTDMLTQGYIGVTKNAVSIRFGQHASAAKCGSDLILHKAMRKHASVTTVVVFEGDEDCCYEFEQKVRPSRHIGWNIVEGGGKSPLSGVYGNDHPCFGRACSDETKEKISLANSGDKNGMAKMVGELNHFFGKTHTGVTKAILSAKPVSAETRAKQSLAKIGTKRSAESVKKTADANRGRKHTPEQRALISSRQIGKFVSEATRELLRNVPQPPAWRNIRANKDVWLRATDIYEVFLIEPSHSYIAKKLSVARSTLLAMVGHFASGWIPSQDADYMLWQAEYRTTKELYGA